jgi:hypothetical protein
VSHFCPQGHARRSHLEEIVSFAFLVGCPVAADALTIYASPTLRGAAWNSHPAEHNANAFAVQVEHPDNAPGESPTFSPDAAVTFFGSMVGQDTASLTSATVVSATTGTDENGAPLDGYLLTVPESDGLTYNLFVLASSLHAA